MTPSSLTDCSTHRKALSDGPVGEATQVSTHQGLRGSRASAPPREEGMEVGLVHWTPLKSQCGGEEETANMEVAHVADIHQRWSGPPPA